MFRMSEDKPQEYKKRLSMELSNSLFREDGTNWGNSAADMDMALLGVEDTYHEQLYQGSSQGPPSVHSVGSRHNPYQNAYDPQGLEPMGPHSAYGHVDAPMDMDPTDLGFDPLEASLPPAHAQQQQNQGQAGQVPWYDTDL